MRASLVSNLKVRAGAPDKDSRITNCFAAQEKGGIVARKRPGIVAPLYSFVAGQAQGGEQCFFLLGDKYNICTSGSGAAIPLSDAPIVVVYVPIQNTIWVYSITASTRRRFNGITAVEILPSVSFFSCLDAVYDSIQQVVWVIGSSSIYKYDAATGVQVGAAISTNPGPLYLSYDVTQNYIWVISSNGVVLQRFNASTGTLIGINIALGTSSQGIAYNPADNAIWVSLDNSTALRINAATGAQIGAALSVKTAGFAYDSTQNVMWCPNWQTNDGFLRYNASTGVFINSVSVGLYLSNLIYDNGNNRIWARTNTNIVAFNALTLALVVGPIIFTEPYDMSYDSTQNAVWVIDRTDKTLTKIDASSGIKIATQSGTPL